MSRGMIPEENLVFDPEASLREVVRWTHYLPEGWEGKLHSQAVSRLILIVGVALPIKSRMYLRRVSDDQIHQEFGTMFAMKISIFFTELLSVLLTPFILWFSLPPCAGAIVDFFREFTVHVDGVGYVCSFAVFDFRRHGQSQEARVRAADDVDVPQKPNGVIEGRIGALLGGQAVPAPIAAARARPTNLSARDRPANAREEAARNNDNHKMEKSFLHFKATHPDWVPDPSSSIFLDRLVTQHQHSRILSPPFAVTGKRAGKRSQLGGSVYATAGGRGLGLGGGATGSIYQGQSMMVGIRICVQGAGISRERRVARWPPGGPKWP